MIGPLSKDLADYLALRRALGYRLARPEKLLTHLLKHLQDAGVEHVRVDAALDWALLPAGGQGSNWPAYRLSVVRGFATYLHGLDPAHEVPATDLLPQRPQRAVPYLYSQSDVDALITATGSLRTPLRQATFATLIGLLAVTGMRMGEAIALDRGDVDLEHGLLLIRHGKFDKARELTLHPTTVTALALAGLEPKSDRSGALPRMDRQRPTTTHHHHPNAPRRSRPHRTSSFGRQTTRQSSAPQRSLVDEESSLIAPNPTMKGDSVIDNR